MTSKYYQFSEEHATAFEAAALQYYDFETCQRSDGSYYGTGGTCRKGTPAEKVEKENKGKGSGAIDTGRMGSMTTDQLQELSKRSELGIRQKGAISQELKLRKDASDDYDKFGNQDRTKAAQKSIDEHYIKKDGGYVPRPEKQMKVEGEDSYRGKDSLKENIQFQRDLGAPNDKAAMQNLIHGDKLMSNGANKNKQDIMWGEGEVSLNKMIGGNHVQLYNRTGTIGWKVNGSYDTQKIPPSTKRQIATETRKMYETMVRSSSNNTPLTTSAYQGDGRGESRVKAYKTMGFSKPDRQGGQYSKVVFGNVIPVSRSEYEDLYGKRQDEVERGTQPMFSESRKKLTSKQLNKLWEIILGL